MTRSLVFLVAAFSIVAQTPEIAVTIAFTEGPTSDRDGNVYGSVVRRMMLEKHILKR